MIYYLKINEVILSGVGFRDTYEICTRPFYISSSPQGVHYIPLVSSDLTPAGFYDMVLKKDCA